MKILHVGALTLSLLSGNLVAASICEQYNSAYDVHNTDAQKLVDYKITKAATLIIIDQYGQARFDDIIRYSVATWNGSGPFNLMLKTTSHECNLDMNADLGKLLADTLVADYDSRVKY
ncbi:hypothetical protein [Shewanella donghaensis]|uniref:hypothetical protein n=1 Tax=Shewanella donghaensis TaxID=238836 RepID=UPI001183B543|nr:hypothetical protein [Shewanella donghaensis]